MTVKDLQYMFRMKKKSTCIYIPGYPLMFANQSNVCVCKGTSKKLHFTRNWTNEGFNSKVKQKNKRHV